MTYQYNLIHRQSFWKSILCVGILLVSLPMMARPAHPKQVSSRISKSIWTGLQIGSLFGASGLALDALLAHGTGSVAPFFIALSWYWQGNFRQRIVKDEVAVLNQYDISCSEPIAQETAWLASWIPYALFITSVASARK